MHDAPVPLVVASVSRRGGFDAVGLGKEGDKRRQRLLEAGNRKASSHV